MRPVLLLVMHCGTALYLIADLLVERLAGEVKGWWLVAGCDGRPRPAGRVEAAVHRGSNGQWTIQEGRERVDSRHRPSGLTLTLRAAATGRELDGTVASAKVRQRRGRLWFQTFR